MSESRQYLVPATLAALLHVALVAAMVFGFALPRNQPITPLAIRATLVQEDTVAPPVPQREEPEPDPEPVVQQPDPDEQARLEEQKRREDALKEQQRLQAIDEAKRAAEAQREREETERRERIERERKEAEARAAEQERKRKEAEDKARRERELEEKRRKAEEERLAEIERQRQENIRKQKEAEAAAMQAAMDEEARRIASINSGARAAYVFAIQQQIQRNWVRPASATPGIECELSVTQLPDGQVTRVSITRCNGDAAVERSIEQAVFKASPLPKPSDPSIFERNLRIVFKPEQ